MVNLRANDLGAVLDVAADAYGLDVPDPLTTELVDRLRDVIGCDLVTYSEYDEVTGAACYVPCSLERDGAYEDEFTFDDCWLERVRSIEHLGIRLLSDRFRRSERLRHATDAGCWTTIYGVVDSLAVAVRVGPSHTVLQLDSQSRDFGKRERELAALLRTLVVGFSGAAALRRRVPQTTNGELLTPREGEVMRLVASGLTTRQIAASLWVTPATVNKHLDNVYDKLGVHSRTAALAALGMTVTEGPRRGREEAQST